MCWVQIQFCMSNFQRFPLDKPDLLQKWISLSKKLNNQESADCFGGLVA